MAESGSLHLPPGARTRADPSMPVGRAVGTFHPDSDVDQKMRHVHYHAVRAWR